jgi:hypothetical protein
VCLVSRHMDDSLIYGLIVISVFSTTLSVYMLCASRYVERSGVF